MATGLIGRGTWSHARSTQSKHCRPSQKILRAVVGEHRVASGLLQRTNPAAIKAPAPLRLTMIPTRSLDYSDRLVLVGRIRRPTWTAEKLTSATGRFCTNGENSSNLQELTET